MKRRIIYKKDGTIYSTVITANAKATIQIEMLKKGVGMSQVLAIQNL